MGLGYQAENVKAPQKRSKNSPDGSANTLTTVRFYTMTGASQSHALPQDWNGKYVRITAEGADLTYYFADADGNVVDNTVTATADGLSSDGTKLGAKLLAGNSRDEVLPHGLKPSAGGTDLIYFVRQGSGAGSVRIELKSD